ncbi:LOW QUALITY PROTEIN: hypothetical protein TorRG33x02_143830 [Trema orientale]|uniref:Uncharacterized protein n=1 Tax=Trema orientale TaxID=63057 RepID=A0A2P5EWE7_TREOI|nr:LOW QUALITY PROTEIN: hypothetical protein TorRG33x02_143830 [Trema orientale]
MATEVGHLYNGGTNEVRLTYHMISPFVVLSLLVYIRGTHSETLRTTAVSTFLKKMTATVSTERGLCSSVP